MNQKLKIGDENYPQILQEISDPPELLFYRGNLDALNYKYAIAVVGTRRCSEYGREATRAITKELARAGITIISGLARGIDTVAHETALESGAPTIAILGSPLGDKEIYPQQNVGLAHKIIEAFCSRKYRIVGNDSTIRVSSVILPFLRGTLRSNRTNTFF